MVEYVIRYSIATPDKVAVEFFPDLYAVDLDNVQTLEHISYAELHRRSSQFARYLVEQGVQREDRVAICHQRDVNFHIVMFGVLKAGGCYVPVSPRYVLLDTAINVSTPLHRSILSSPSNVKSSSLKIH